MTRASIYLILMSATVFCFSSTRVGGLQKYICNAANIKGMPIQKTFSNYSDSTIINNVQCDSARQALILASCYINRNSDCVVLVSLFCLDINDISADIGTLASSLTKGKLSLYTESTAFGLGKLKNINHFHILLRDDHFGIAPVGSSSNTSIRSVACRCHDNKVDIFWICTGCGAIFCRLVPNCSACGSRFIISKGTPGF